jgi:hypothetical protein
VVTVSGGKITQVLGVFDPGVYNNVPGTATAASDTTGGSTNNPGSGATFKLTEGCFTWPGASVGGIAWKPIAGRKYCSIKLSGQQTVNFPAGNYWIAGGDGTCAGFCMSGSNAVATSDVAGVTFFLTNGEGATANSLPTVSIQGGQVNLCSPGTNCGTTCTNAAGPASCMLFVQNPLAPCIQANTCVSTGAKSPGTTNNLFNGGGNNAMAGLLYLPKQTFTTAGVASIGNCFGVIAKYVDIGGTPIFQNGCLPGNGIGGITTTVTTFSNPYLYQ